MRVINLADPPYEYDAEDPEGFKAGCYRWGPEVGAVATGTSVYLIPPGQSICPYHYEAEEEEWMLVLEGRPTLRTPDGEVELGPLDSVFCPPGPQGAHKLTNHTDQSAKVLMYSERHSTAVSVYPDSDKVGVYVRGQPEAEGPFPRAAKVDYYAGEV